MRSSCASAWTRATLYRRFVGDAAYEAFDEMKKSPYNEGIRNYHDGLCYRERPYTEEGEKGKAAEWVARVSIRTRARQQIASTGRTVDLELTEGWCPVEEDDVHRCCPGRVDWGHIDDRARLV
jgi:hypothetical protein